MSQFTVRGRFQNRDGWAPFEKVIEADNENVAQEWTYSKLGSEHNLKRTQIEIEEVAAQ
jgi:large subunit ribosomal protein LX